MCVLTAVRRGRGEILHHQAPEIYRWDGQSPLEYVSEGKMSIIHLFQQRAFRSRPGETRDDDGVSTKKAPQAVLF
jgi:hypothetical protein